MCVCVCVCVVDSELYVVTLIPRSYRLNSAYL